MEKSLNPFRDDFYGRAKASFTSDDLVKYHASLSEKFSIREEEVELYPAFGEKGYRKGLYDFPSTVVSWGVTEMDPGVKSPFHRQLHEATHFILEGKGYSVINGERFDWEEGDVVFTPIHSWHQNVNDGREKVRYATAGTVPFFKFLGVYRDDSHHEPGQETLNTLKKEMPPSLVVKKKDWLPQTVAGKTVDFPFPTVVATKRMAASMPAKSPATFLHRHFTEALIYILKGHGFSLVHDRRVEWEPGSVVRVPIYCWHTHFNPGDELEVHLRHISSGLNNHLQWKMIDNLPPANIQETPLAKFAEEIKELTDRAKSEKL